MLTTYPVGAGQSRGERKTVPGVIIRVRTHLASGKDAPMGRPSGLVIILPSLWSRTTMETREVTSTYYG